MKLKDERKLRKTGYKAALMLVNLQRDLHDAGLHATAHQVNEASKKLGWEIAGKVSK